jgi:dUTP pyrophosphatase
MELNMWEMLVKDLEGSGKCLPNFERIEDAGLDLYSAEDKILPANNYVVINLGIATAFPRQFVALLRDRSSMAGRGITVMGGVIDSGYRGEWKVVLLNTTPESVTIHRYQKIIQAIFVMRAHLNVNVVTSLPSSERETGGFGSTGH